MKNKKYYTQLELDEYVRKLLTDSEIALSKQAERIEKERKENENLNKELEELRKKEKSNARLLVLSERKAKYLEQTTYSKCVIEIDRLVRLAEKWEDFFDDLSNKYDDQDKNQLDEFKEELSKTIDGLIEIEDIFKGDTIPDSVNEHVNEITRVNQLTDKQASLDDRFSKLVLEFNMKIGDNATRGRGRPKKSEGNNVKDIEKKFNKEENQTHFPLLVDILELFSFLLY